MGAMTFERRFPVGWNNLDANAHLANRAYLDALHSRVRNEFW